MFKTITGESGLFRESLGERFEYGRADAFCPWPGWPPHEKKGTS
jgi:hypothetical protein